MRNGKAFPHRVSAMIGNEQYEHLKKESEAHGYQIALIERWMLIPQNVDDLYAGSLDDADRMMRRPLPSGTRGGGKRRCRECDFWLTDAGYEAVTRCAVKRGLIRSAYVAEVIHEQVRIANESGWHHQRVRREGNPWTATQPGRVLFRSMSSEDSKRKPYVKRVVYRMENICEPYVNHA